MTNNPTPEQMRKDRAMDVDEIVPSLADREAAAEAINPPDGWNPSEWAAEIIARHRIAARRQALEEAARHCDEYGEINFETCGDNILMDPLLHGGPWTQENVELSDKCSVSSTIHSSKFHACQEIAATLRKMADSHVDQD